MMKRIFKKHISIFALTITLVGCVGIGTAEFGDLADGVTASGGQSNINFSGIDSIDQITDTTARINWTNHPDAVTYDIYNVSSGTTFVTSIVAPATSYELNGLSPSTAYEYRVRARDNKGLIDNNTTDVSFTTNLAPNPPSTLALQEPTTSPNFDATPTIRISGVKNGDTIRLFTDVSCTSQVGSASVSGTSVDITSSSLSAGTYTFHANATNSNGDSSTCSSATVAYTAVLCTTGFAAVPGNSSLSVDAFCVMEFEAKNVSGTPTSQAGGTPWVSINQTNAKAGCTSLGANYDLISNPEWMTIAFEIEKTTSNWSGSAVGSGQLNRGHTDNSPGSAQAVTDVNDPYIGTGNNSGQAVGSGWEQKRTHTLSNGSVLWDIAGNVWEWTDWSLGGGLTSGPTSCTASWTELPDVACGALSSADYLPDNPSGQSTYNSSFGLGRLYGGSGGAAYRGGNRADGTSAGAFALRMNSAPSGIHGDVGFRCVYRP